jgi:hypothetical protein
MLVALDFVVAASNDAKSTLGLLEEILQKYPVLFIVAFLAYQAAMAIGIVPVDGPSRAMWLIFYSWVTPRTFPQSARKTELESLQELLNNLGPYNYVIVCGPKGVGKSCLVESVLNWKPVIRVWVTADMKEAKILQLVYSEICGSPFPLFATRSASARVFFFLKLFSLWRYRRPIIYICAYEVTAGKKPADLTGAVRDLTERLGARVIIDASDDSLPNNVFDIGCRLFNVEPMDPATVMSIPDFRQLFTGLKRAGLDGVAWAVFGGVPCSLQRMKNADDCTGKVGMALARAIGNRSQLVAKYPHLREILLKFKTVDQILKGVHLLPAQNYVLRVFCRGGIYLVPSSTAMAIVLKHNWVEVPSIADLKQTYPSAQCPLRDLYDE